MLKKNWIKFLIGWAACFAIRLIPFRPPNAEPILATQMPFAKRYGWIAAFFFGFLSIVLYDLIWQAVGMWTFITAAAYGLLGVGAYFFFRNRESNIKNYLVYGVAGTLVYDAVTGLSVGPIFFGQPFLEALLGQIPFTLMHLGGTVFFALTVSPALYAWVVENPKLEISAIFSRVSRSV